MEPHYQSRSTSRPPSRSLFEDDIVVNSTPASTLEAFTNPTGRLKASIEGATQREQEFGMRAVRISKQIAEWVLELSEWPYSNIRIEIGFPKERAESHQPADWKPQLLGDHIQVDREQAGFSPVIWFPESVFVAYDDRLNQIRTDLNEIDMEELKRHIVQTHFSQTSQEFFVDRSFVTVGDDFSAMVIATLLHALPNLKRLDQLIDLWIMRLNIFREGTLVAQEMTDLSYLLDVEKVIELDRSIPGTTLRQTFVQINRAISHDAAEIADGLRFMVDTLGEGQLNSDKLHCSWRDNFNLLKNDYMSWVQACETSIVESESEIHQSEVLHQRRDSLPHVSDLDRASSESTVPELKSTVKDEIQAQDNQGTAEVLARNFTHQTEPPDNGFLQVNELPLDQSSLESHAALSTTTPVQSKTGAHPMANAALHSPIVPNEINIDNQDKTAYGALTFSDSLSAQATQDIDDRDGELEGAAGIAHQLTEALHRDTYPSSVSKPQHTPTMTRFISELDSDRPNSPIPTTNSASHISQMDGCSGSREVRNKNEGLAHLQISVPRPLSFSHNPAVPSSQGYHDVPKQIASPFGHPLSNALRRSTSPVEQKALEPTSTTMFSSNASSRHFTKAPSESSADCKVSDSRSPVIAEYSPSHSLSFGSHTASNSNNAHTIDGSLDDLETSCQVAGIDDQAEATVRRQQLESGDSTCEVCDIFEEDEDIRLDNIDTGLRCDTPDDKSADETYHVENGDLEPRGSLPMTEDAVTHPYPSDSIHSQSSPLNDQTHRTVLDGPGNRPSGLDSPTKPATAISSVEGKSNMRRNSTASDSTVVLANTTDSNKSLQILQRRSSSPSISLNGDMQRIGPDGAVKTFQVESDFISPSDHSQIENSLATDAEVALFHHEHQAVYEDLHLYEDQPVDTKASVRPLECNSPPVTSSMTISEDTLLAPAQESGPDASDSVLDRKEVLVGSPGRDHSPASSPALDSIEFCSDAEDQSSPSAGRRRVQTQAFDSSPPDAPSTPIEAITRGHSLLDKSESMSSDTPSPETPIEAPILGNVDVATGATLTSPKKASTDAQIQQQISHLLESIPANIRLTNESEPIPFTSETLRVPKTRRSVNPSLRSTSSMSNYSTSSRAATPSFTLAPAYGKGMSRPKQQTSNSEIRVYHLSRSGQAPIKLFVRLVGEHGERVMVRVGGGWSDLGEYLKDYASHHGRRGDMQSSDKVEIQDLPPRLVSSGSRNSSATTIRANGRASPLPYRPASSMGIDRPSSSLNIRKTRKSIGESSNDISPIPSRVNDKRFPSTPLPMHRDSFNTPSSIGSAASGRSSRMDFDEEEGSLGLAGPKSKRVVISEKDQEWVQSMKEKVRLASAEKERREQEKAGRDRGTSFGEIGKIGATKRLFVKKGES